MNLVQAMSEALRELAGMPPQKQQKQKYTASVSQPQTIPAVPARNCNIVLPMPAPQILQQFVEENRASINTFIYRKLKHGVLNDLSEVVLWRLADTSKFTIIERKDFAETLDKLGMYFIQTEQYEHASSCKRLIDKHNINRVIYEANEEYRSRTEKPMQ